ncbi:hypothetical protein F5X68DRAFT_248415 [Plectosphaerella plurivora]|uniref:G domain-containing protein n=1 Tax=Plectosphaerella plurivora TaxID=936078 RepID=A0A9P9AE52_9PEZI|nr:hypothetical protein F5X68DRAFT_248415 [Plectosphaerella plurivora]
MDENATSSLVQFFEGYQPRDNDLFIILIGFSGAGKSNLISQCHEVSPSINVYLIDTPGFDNSRLTDHSVLALIARWLVEAYSRGIRIHGLLYFHSLNDKRFCAIARRNCDMVRDLCGPAACLKTVLVTTRWDEHLLEHAVLRQQTFIDTPGLWCEIGGPVRQHFNTEQSARDILDFFVNGDRRPVILAIQHEIIKHKMAVRDTSSYRVLGYIPPLPSMGFFRTGGTLRRDQVRKHLKSTCKAEKARMKKSQKKCIWTLEHVVNQQRRALEASRPITKVKRAGSSRATSGPDARPPQPAVWQWRDISEDDGPEGEGLGENDSGEEEGRPEDYYPPLGRDYTFSEPGFLSLSGKDFWMASRIYEFRQVYFSAEVPTYLELVQGIPSYVDLCCDAEDRLYIEHSDNLADHYALLYDCLQDNADIIESINYEESELTLGSAGTFWFTAGNNFWFNLPLGLHESLRKQQIDYWDVDFVALGVEGTYFATIREMSQFIFGIGDDLYPGLEELMRNVQWMTRAGEYVPKISSMALDLQSKTDYAVFFDDGTLYKNTNWDETTNYCFRRWRGLERGLAYPM